MHSADGVLGHQGLVLGAADCNDADRAVHVHTEVSRRFAHSRPVCHRATPTTAVAVQSSLSVPKPTICTLSESVSNACHRLSSFKRNSAKKFTLFCMNQLDIFCFCCGQSVHCSFPNFGRRLFSGGVCNVPASFTTHARPRCIAAYTASYYL